MSMPRGTRIRTLLASTALVVLICDGGRAQTINEFVANHVGTDVKEYVEIFGLPNFDYSALSILQIEGDSSAGIIDSVFQVGTTDAQGFWVTGFLNNVIENGTMSLFLVEDFSGTQGQDLDTGNTGVFDVTPWFRVVDSIGVWDGDVGDANYGAPVLAPGFDGSSFSVGGASRLPDGTDTDTDADWTRNDFNLAGIVAGTPATGTTFNTPGTTNGVDPNPPLSQVLSIMEIQGPGHVSPEAGNRVVTGGVVTAVASNGFYMQDPVGDGDDRTSDGIFVFTGGAPGVQIGDAVEVEGTVREFFNETQLGSSPVVTVVGSGQSIVPTTISTNLAAPSSNPHRAQPNTIIDDLGSVVFDPTTDGRDFYESLEGMLVTLVAAQAVSDEDTRPNRGEFYAVSRDDAEGNLTSLNSRGGITISADTVNSFNDNPLEADLNPERILIVGTVDSDTRPDTPPEMGDLVGSDGGDITGVVQFSFNDYRIRPLAPVVTTEVDLPDEVTALAGDAMNFTVATYNVFNLDPNAQDGNDDIGSGRFAGLARQIVTNMGAPDVVALQEIQDNSGAVNDGTVSAALTLQTLVDAIVEAGGPTYAFLDNPFIGDNTSGGAPGANIRTAFLYNADRVPLTTDSVATIDQDGTITGTPSAGLQTDPASPFFDTRLPLVMEFSFAGESFTIINNHFSSKGGSDPLFGTTQPPANGSVEARNAQAAAVNAAVDSLLAFDLLANIIVLGDFNEFQFLEPLSILTGSDDGSNVLINLAFSNPDPTDVFTFEFEGNSQALDHILVSQSVFDRFVGIDFVHMNAGRLFETLLSDHDPIVAQFLGQVPVAVAAPTSLSVLLAAFAGLALVGQSGGRRRRA